MVSGQETEHCASHTVEKNRLRRVRCADNVRAQLQVWEDHNTRISCDRGVLFEWDPAECDLATFDMIMKHAVTSKGLLWFCKEYVDGQDFSLVVKASAAPEFRLF